MTDNKFARKCDECGAGMNEGYLIDGASECYCSDHCLHKNVTPDEFAEFYIGNIDDDDDDIPDIQIFWTEWEADDDAAA
jgi:uncharacterized protein YciU (UPF0263 family)